MPWITPTRDELRALNRDNVSGMLKSGPIIPNSALRVMTDANAGLAHLVMLYIDNLAKQLLPDTAEDNWLDRHADIWLGGRKAATFAAVVINVTGIQYTPVPAGTQFSAATVLGTVFLQTTESILVGSPYSTVNAVALTPGMTGISGGLVVSPSVAISGIDACTIGSISDGVNEETDDALRARVLERIRQPPMGGDAEDYVHWALEVPGVTRAWSSPNEMGVGTVVLRFMMDNVRASSNPLSNGFPTDADVTTVLNHLNTKRPVAVKDFFVVSPQPEPISFTLSNVSAYNAATTLAINKSVSAMLSEKAAPAYAVNGVRQNAQTIYAAWISEAVLATPGVDFFDLTMLDHVMPNSGALAVLGTVTYV